MTSNQWLPTLRSAQSAARKALAEIRDDEDRAHAVKAFAAHGAKYHKVAARGGRGCKEASLGAMLGAIGADDFLRQANEYGQADGDHASSRTDPDDAERLTGIYGSDGVPCPSGRAVLFRRTIGPWGAEARG